MVTKCNRVKCPWWIFMLIATLNTIRHGGFEALRTLDTHNFKHKPNGTIKTIEIPEDGDMIDCVDIYKQPAFENPLIKNLKMEPSSKLSLFNTTKDHRPKLIQNWHKFGECPQGTIPIRRTWINATIQRKTPNDDPIIREYATAYELKDTYHGAGALFNVWNPKIDRKSEFSLSQMWITSVSNSSLANRIESGWMVYPDLYHDHQTRFFIYWTRDNYGKTGCYDLTCSGFVQTGRHYALGGTLTPSTYNETTYDIFISMSRDVEGDWWLKVEDTVLGYFPMEIFTTLGEIGATQVEFGGEIGNNKDADERISEIHTQTHMGSGHLSYEGLHRASSVHNIKVVNGKYETVDARLNFHITRAECYDLNFGPSDTDYGSHFFYGGPGYSSQCVYIENKNAR